MTIIKSGTCSSKIVVSESVYSCPDCGYTEIIETAEDDSKKCPHCDIIMGILSSSSHIENNDEEVVEKDEE